VTIDEWYETGQLEVSIHTRVKRVNDLAMGLNGQVSCATARTIHEQLASATNLHQRLDPELKDQFLWGLQAAYTKAFCEAFEVRPDFRNWARDNYASWSLLLLGGGCRHAFVAQDFREHPPKFEQIHAHTTVESLGAPRRLSILRPNGRLIDAPNSNTLQSDTDVLRLNASMLTVAYGLSFRAPDIPKYGIEPMVDPPELAPAWEPGNDTAPRT
jgi:hypothetical protein